MNKIIYGWIAIIGLLFTGCAATQKVTMLDENWGRAHETARYSQIIQPEAEKQIVPVKELDGVAANHMINEYRKTFKEKETTTQIFNINLGNK